MFSCFELVIFFYVHLHALASTNMHRSILLNQLLSDCLSLLVCRMLYKIIPLLGLFVLQ